MDQPKPYTPRCIYLTCKSMQVWGDDFENDPEYQAGIVEFWCTQTMKPTGPDGDTTSVALCSKPERSCFREFFVPMDRPPASSPGTK